MRPPKKRSIPRRSARKNKEDSSLRFFIFETLSQRFFRVDHRGILHFFSGRIFYRENCETKSPVFIFLKKAEKRRKVRAKRGVKN